MIYWYEQDKNTAVIKFYANIEWWNTNASNVTALFELLDAKYNTIIFRVHCYGGNVFEGNAIYNVIAGANAKVIWRIEGVCMSMGSIIMMACDEIEMCENSVVMIHEPSGGAYGMEKDMLEAAKQLGILKKNAAKAYAKAIGITQAEFTAKYFDGFDHSLDAEEAESLGLITTIIPGVVKNVKQVPIPAPGDGEQQQYDYAAIYNRYAALQDMHDENEQEYKPGMKITRRKAPAAQSVISKSDIKMKEQLIAQYGLKGVTKDTPDAEFMAVLKAHTDSLGGASSNQPPAPAATAAPAADAKVVAESVIASVESITGQKFEAEHRKSLLSIGEKAGVEALQLTMKHMVSAKAEEQPEGAPAAPRIEQYIAPGAQGASSATAVKDRKDWNWNDWQKNDPKGLSAMEDKEPQRFNALYKAEYGVEPGK